jgi:hypothetical protein
MEKFNPMTEYEAFVYLWYDSNNKKFYLGCHKGTITDGYAHSSTIMESFRLSTAPEGFKRRILAYGPHKDMIDLEAKLLRNRFDSGRWDRYYNANLGGDPGMWHDPEYRKMQSEKTRKQNEVFWQDPAYREMQRKKAKAQWADPAFRKMQSETNMGQNNPMSRTNRLKREQQRAAK